MATNKTKIVWVQPPKTMAKNLDLYGTKLIDAVFAVAEFMADKVQNYARQNAKWQDRTGNARSGLFGVARKNERDSRGQFVGLAQRTVEIYLSHGHTIEYGVFLELANAGRYAIIWPALDKHLPELKKMLDDIFK